MITIHSHLLDMASKCNAEFFHPIYNDRINIVEVRNNHGNFGVLLDHILLYHNEEKELLFSIG